MIAIDPLASGVDAPGCVMGFFWYTSWLKLLQNIRSWLIPSTAPLLLNRFFCRRKAFWDRSIMPHG
jgi:hypothetical protein